MVKKTLPTFETLSNTFTARSIIGQGGSGTVYEVVDTEGHPFALKFLSSATISKEKVKRFKNEMTFLMRNRHDNLVPVFDAGFVQDNEKRPFYVMPHYACTLRTLIKQGISPDNVVRYLGQILNGVEALHLKDVWHRDLKPENILFDVSSDRLAVADLGIAHFAEEELYTLVETKAATRLANFQYAAPEQRKPGRGVGHLADIFSIGLILNEMFTQDVLQGTGHRTIATVSEKHSYLDELVTGMVQQQPENRIQSIAAIKLQLIARKNESIQLQKLSELKETVIPDSEIEDPLIFNPVSITSVDYEKGLLIFTLSQNTTNEWINNFRNPQFGITHPMGKGPSAFQVRGDRMSIESNETDATRIYDFLKDYLPRANNQYTYEMRRRFEDAERQKRRQLEAEIQRNEREQAVRKSILDRIKI